MTSCSRRPRSAAFLTCRFERSALTLPRMHNSLMKWHKREPLQEKAPGPGSGAARLLPCWPLTLPPASCWNRPRPETWPIWLPPRRPLPVSGPLPGSSLSGAPWGHAGASLQLGGPPTVIWLPHPTSSLHSSRNWGSVQVEPEYCVLDRGASPTLWVSRPLHPGFLPSCLPKAVTPWSPRGLRR